MPKSFEGGPKVENVNKHEKTKEASINSEKEWQNIVDHNKTEGNKFLFTEKIGDVLKFNEKIKGYGEKTKEEFKPFADNLEKVLKSIKN